MDEAIDRPQNKPPRRRSDPLPERLRDLPDHTIEYLMSLTPEKIARQKRWDEAYQWAETSGKIIAWLAGIMVAILGLYIAYQEALDKWREPP